MENAYQRAEPEAPVVLDALSEVSAALARWDDDVSDEGGVASTAAPPKRNAFDERADALRREQEAALEEDHVVEGKARLKAAEHQKRLVIAAKERLEQRARAGERERLLRIAGSSDSTAGEGYGQASTGTLAAGAQHGSSKQTGADVSGRGVAATGTEQAAIAAALAVARPLEADSRRRPQEQDGAGDLKSSRQSFR